MNWIDILWALLTLISAIVFISGNWIAQRKIRLLNYFMALCLIIYIAEVMQTVTHLTAIGYLFRMLTWTIQASFIALSLMNAWRQPWFESCKFKMICLNVAISLMLMSCLCPLVLP